ncbi:MAG: hypothetical protein H7145_10695 [Akkermansiaceae bacterium]|nr:hypothetical protein [Armatimonadota bacterium]
MKYGRAVGIVLFLLVAMWTARAIYLNRIWTIARIWTQLPPAVSPHPGDFFLPDAWGSTAHGVYADVVFIKVRGSFDLNATITARLKGRGVARDSASPEDCNTSDRFRLNPARIAPEELARCYSVSDRFGSKINAEGLAFRLDDSVGGWVVANEADHLYLAVYRTR